MGGGGFTPKSLVRADEIRGMIAEGERGVHFGWNYFGSQYVEQGLHWGGLVFKVIRGSTWG